MTIQKILDDNFKGFEDAMGGDKELAHFYKSVVGVCIQEYTLDILGALAENKDCPPHVLSAITKVEKEVWN